MTTCKRATLVNHSIFIILAAILYIITQVPHASCGQFPASPTTSSNDNMHDGQLSAEYDVNDPHKSTQHFKKYLKEKYINITEAVSRIHKTTYGPSGNLSVIGEITPLKKTDLSTVTDKHVRARKIARAFIEDEPALFGIINPDELREVNIRDGKGRNGNYSIIYYRRYINNIELEKSELDIDIKDNDNINSFSARLVPVPPEVYEATKKKTLSEEGVWSIVEADLKENKIDPNGLQISCQKIAIIIKPYVVWKVMSHWVYTINAFTGEIIRKDPNWKE